MDASSRAAKITITFRNKMNVIPLSEIEFVESNKRKIIVHAKEGIYQTYSTMKAFRDTLPHDFIQCHNSYLVNIEHITTISTTEIEVASGARIPVSRKYANDVKEKVKLHYRLLLTKTALTKGCSEMYWKEFALCDFDSAHVSLNEDLLDTVAFFVLTHFDGNQSDPAFEPYKRERAIEALYAFKEASKQEAAEMFETIPDAQYMDRRSTPPHFPIYSLILEEALCRAETTFTEMLLELIDLRGLTDPEVYKRAHIDRRLFSKIRSHKNYIPSKDTVLALAIALELTVDETSALLRRAGYALSHSIPRDIIIECFIDARVWDIPLIDDTLYAFSLPLLGN